PQLRRVSALCPNFGAASPRGPRRVWPRDDFAKRSQFNTGTIPAIDKSGKTWFRRSAGLSEGLSCFTSSQRAGNHSFHRRLGRARRQLLAGAARNAARVRRGLAAALFEASLSSPVPVLSLKVRGSRASKDGRIFKSSPPRVCAPGGRSGGGRS